MPKTLGIWEWGCPKRCDSALRTRSGQNGLCVTNVTGILFACFVVIFSGLLQKDLFKAISLFPFNNIQRDVCSIRHNTMFNKTELQNFLLC